jgi:hypothetical protein
MTPYPISNYVSDSDLYHYFSLGLLTDDQEPNTN